MSDLPISAIEPNPGQPRKHFDPDALDELAQSIRTYGLLEPVIVRQVKSHHPPVNGCTMARDHYCKDRFARYELIAGERRWRASQIAELKAIPAIIRKETDATAFELSMIENVVRADMNAMEEAEGYERLMSLGATIDQIADRLGVKAGTIANRVKLTQLAEPIRELVRTGQLDAYTGSQLSVLSTEGQFRYLRAMQGGKIRYLGDEARIIAAIKADEEQAVLPMGGQVPDERGSMDGEDPEAGNYDEGWVDPTVKAARAAGLVLDLLGQAARALESIEGPLATANDLDRLSLVAESVKKQAARVTASVHKARASRIAEEI